MASDKRELDKIYKRRDRYEIPDWQREKVWDVARKQSLIDSILRGWRLPKFYFVISDTNPPTYEVVDGQQRLAAIFEFFADELELSDETAEKFVLKLIQDWHLKSLTVLMISRLISMKLKRQPMKI